MSHNTINDAGQLDIIELSPSELMTVTGGYWPAYYFPSLMAIKRNTGFLIKPGGPGLVSSIRLAK